MSSTKCTEARRKRLKAAGLCTNCGVWPKGKTTQKCDQCTRRGRRNKRPVAPCTASSLDFPNDSHKVPK